MAWLAGVAALVVITIAQELFYETHRRRYGLWRSTRERRLWMNPEERSLAWDALVHRNAEPAAGPGQTCYLTVA